MLGISTTNARVGGFRGGILADAKTIYNRIIADGGVSNLTRLNFFVKGLKAIYGDLSNVPICYDAHWIGYKLGSGTGATAGQAVAKLYSLTVAGDAAQATAASQPLLLAHNGASSDNYFYTGPGSDVAGAVCQTNTNVSPQINTDFTFEFNFKDFNSRGILAGCPTASANGWSLQIQATTNVLRLYVRNASVNVTIDSTVGINVTGNRWVKVVRSGNNYSFFEKSDGGTYTQVGTTVTNSTVLNSYSLPIQIGDGFRINYIGIGCKILRAKFYSDSTETNLVSDFNPATYNASTSQTAWTSATGEVWTISTGTATTGYKGCLVSRTIVQGDGVDDKVSTTGVTLANNHTNYCAYEAFVQDVTGNRVIYNNGTTNFVNSISSINTNNILLVLTPVIYATVGTKILNTLGLTTTVFGTNATRNKVNNGTFSSPLTGVYVGGAGLSLFGMPTTHFANSSINTIIISSSDDNATINTAMYNFIRSLNNNSF